MCIKYKLDLWKIEEEYLQMSNNVCLVVIFIAFSGSFWNEYAQVSVKHTSVQNKYKYGNLYSKFLVCKITSARSRTFHLSMQVPELLVFLSQNSQLKTFLGNLRINTSIFPLDPHFFLQIYPCKHHRHSFFTKTLPLLT